MKPAPTGLFLVAELKWPVLHELTMSKWYWYLQALQWQFEKQAQY